MKLRRVFLFALAGIIFTGACLFAAGIKSTNAAVTTPPVYVPNLSRAGDALPEDLLVWDSPRKTTNAAANADAAHFVFSFTNVSPDNVVIMNVHPSCGCTTAQLPPLPWTIPPGTNGEIGVTVNLEGKNGTLFKTVTVSTDKGSTNLVVVVTILPVPAMTDADRARGVSMAKVDRQAVFHNDCATCHLKPGEGKYSQQLYVAVCGICHEAANRATMVPDLHNLKVPTNPDFWKQWIAHGKPGSLMPAFSTAEGGPLSDMQIASLAEYLNAAYPSHAAPPPQ